ncbi:ABC transporter ATP-binding protein/permease [Streptomyces sp. NBC_00237]|uniref:ABC transporter ATP-binding protein n=1 Tax=Streptomyces sp. NBC_00237 TaxID=2975687 RepID=UPI0022510743|nr:ABC transporter ATP-binding protein [Streptomyces sp. NBC_00237]MCX5201352.1 ABC transporter ATP-binding protein/permease [Streptomyces sp. NBC_00237]
MRALLGLLRPRLHPYRRTLALVVALQLAQIAATLYLPTLNADVINKGVLTGDTGYVLSSGGRMIAVTVVQVAAAAAAVWFGARVAMGIGRDLRSAVFSRVQDFSVREVGQFGASSLITRTTNDVQQVQMLTVLLLTMLVAAPLMCLGGIVMALSQDVPLALLMLVFVPVLGGVVGTIVHRMPVLFRRMQERIDRVNRMMREQITGIRVVRAFVRDQHEQDRYARANTELMQMALRSGRLMALLMPSILIVWELATIAVIWAGGQRIDSGSLQVGSLIAFLGYLMQILMAVMMTAFLMMQVPRAEVSAERIREVLDTEPSVVPPTTPVRELFGRGQLALRDADFSYPGAEEPVLRGVSLTARPGRTTAIIGSTGSGKTTLLHLIPRLFDATGGEVVVGGANVRDIDPDLLSRTVGLVPQKPYLFSGTVASNLRYGNPDATDADLWHALGVAQARDFVESLGGGPGEGLDAPVAQGGTNLSGGQRQRLSIARALVTRPGIYLFDDSFSALDYATDAALRRALAAETAEATVVIVAQRVSTIRDADSIVVLDEGRVVGTGTHTSLMRDNQTYREIVLSQLTEEEAA